MLDVQRAWLVARREWWTRLRQRSFIITTIVQVLFVAAAGCLPVVIAALSGDAPSASRVLVLDQADAGVVERLAPFVKSPGDTGDGDVVEFRPSDIGVDEARGQVDGGRVDAALVVSRTEEGDLAFAYIDADGAVDSLSQQVFAGAAAIALEDRLERSGVDRETFVEATTPPTFTLESPSPGQAGDDTGVTGLEVALSYFFTIVMFMAIMLYGTWVAQGVVEEKSSRIMEIMINAATPRDLLAGKVIGIGAAGLTQLLPMLLTGGLLFGLQKPIARLFDVDTSSLPDVDFSGVSLAAVGWFLVYFLLGYTLFAAMYAGLGSLVSRQEEVNQAISPMMTVMFVGYFGAFFTMFIPDSIWARVLSIFPLTSPFVMVSRVIVGDPAAWEMALSVGLLAVTMIAAILVAARLYRIGVLLYGQKPGWKALVGQQLPGTAR